MKIEWEPIDSNHSNYITRAKVFGGWLVMSTDEVQTQIPEQWGQGLVSFRNEEGYQWRTSICFVPDPKHEWK
jgi:hypothetical protein